jgi:hypothetical protein
MAEFNNLSKSGLWVKIPPSVAEIFEFFRHSPKKNSNLFRENAHMKNRRIFDILKKLPLWADSI